MQYFERILSWFTNTTREGIVGLFTNNMFEMPVKEYIYH
jgi:hypothetical protein